MSFSEHANQAKYPFILPKLPYGKASLIPHLSIETFDYHYDKHHKAYVDNLNKLIPGSKFEGKDLEQIIIESSKEPSAIGIFNNAAQVWNHTFYWRSMTSGGGGEVSQGPLLNAINKSFGSFADFKSEFKKAAAHFASAWIWLAQDVEGKLRIVSTSNAQNPITMGMKPLITCDIWEHAYYIDFRNRRPDYVDTFLSHLVNWEFAEKNYKN